MSTPILQSVIHQASVAPKLAEALRAVLPLAKAYLKGAPRHPDNGKLAEAMDALAEWDAP